MAMMADRDITGDKNFLSPTFRLRGTFPFPSADLDPTFCLCNSSFMDDVMFSHNAANPRTDLEL